MNLIQPTNMKQLLDRKYETEPTKAECACINRKLDAHYLVNKRIFDAFERQPEPWPSEDALSLMEQSYDRYQIDGGNQ